MLDVIALIAFPPALGVALTAAACSAVRGAALLRHRPAPRLITAALAELLPVVWFAHLVLATIYVHAGQPAPAAALAALALTWLACWHLESDHRWARRLRLTRAPLPSR